MGDGSHDVFTEEVPRLPIPMIQSGLQYVIHEGSFEEEEGVLISLKVQRLSQENRMKVVEGLVRDRTSTIQHASCRSSESVLIQFGRQEGR
jgi:hypothetical protein